MLLEFKNLQGTLAKFRLFLGSLFRRKVVGAEAYTDEIAFCFDLDFSQAIYLCLCSHFSQLLTSCNVN